MSETYHPTAPGLAGRIGSRILHELREALPPTLFFFLGFNFIVLTTNLLVAQYAVAVSNFMLATLAALVVGKAVLTANAGRSGTSRRRRRPGAVRRHPW